jgi:hypothetical protein
MTTFIRHTFSQLLNRGYPKTFASLLLLCHNSSMPRAALLLLLALVCSACNSGSPSGSGASVGPTFTTVDPPGSSTQGAILFCSLNGGTHPQDINASGTIIGSFLDANQTSHGFIRSPDGTFTVVDAPNVGTGCTIGTWLAAVNISGTAAGWASEGFSTLGMPATNEAFTRAPNGRLNFIESSNPGPSGVTATSINASGTVLGYFFDPGLFTVGFIAPANGGLLQPIDIPASKVPGQGIFPSRIDASGNIVGSYTDTSGIPHGFLLGAGGTFDTLDAPGGNTTATDINSNGAIVGYVLGVTNQSFVRTADGTYTIFNPPGVGPGGSQAVGINSNGTIAGNFTDAASIPHGFLLNTNGTYTIIDDPDALQAPGSGTTITRVNDSGAVIGYYFDAEGNRHGFLRQ